MHYLIIIQILCGFFAAYVAARKGRNRYAWWLAGAFLPVVGVVLALLADQASSGSPALSDRLQGAPGRPLRRERPKRCCGSYIPDCLGCPYFRRHLFEQEHRERVRGSCEYYGEDLIDERSKAGSGVLMDEP
ncbi:MAG: hypothetical protein ACOC7T_00450 [Planctomycetota bacterium]